MIDNHAHVGWYSDGYHSPKEIWSSASQAGFDEIVVSSTSTCVELYKLVVKEIRELDRISNSNIHPVLWLTPRMFHSNCRWGLRYMLNSKIKWDGIKMHWGLHKEWFYNPNITKDAITIARELQLPILLHTGEFKECEASVFGRLCKDNADLLFVLAHGRPIDQAIEVLKDNSNSFVDTAFMPIYHIVQLVEEGFSSRILFGSDIPINQIYYTNITTTTYLERRLSNIKKALSIKDYKQIITNTVYNSII